MRTTTVYLSAGLGLLLCACPFGPKDDEGTDDAADGTTGEPVSSSSPAPQVPPRGAGETDGGDQSCEDELAKVKAALESCETAK